MTEGKIRNLINHDNILLSIVIPTRNRLEYCRFSIQSILRIPFPSIQLVIEDNSDHNNLESWVKDNVSDMRLSYHYSNTPISMVENYERAMERTIGEYVCLLGDDDGLNPEIVDATRWMKANAFDALLPAAPVHYVWPDLKMRTGSQAPGELRIGSFTGDISFPDPQVEICKCAQSAGQCFHNLPKVYYGIVRRVCLEQVRNKAGKYFPGVSPDMAVAISVADVVDRMCRIDYPLFVPGSSARSNAGIGGIGKHIGRLRDQPHLPANSEQTWSKIVPAFYSVETIWAEAAVKALQAIGRTDILTDFNVPRLYADLVMWHPEYISLTVRSFFRALKSIKRSYLIGTLQFVGRWFYVWGLRAKSMGLRLACSTPSSTFQSVNGLQDIGQAVDALTMYLKASGRRFDEKLP